MSLLSLKRFNLNLLECKCVNHEQYRLYPLVLISTYWNVNTAKDMYSCIEAGFNLNLLECKFTVIILYHALGIVLISTYWNVNFSRR